MKQMIEWSIRRKNGSRIRSLWTTTEAEAEAIIDTAKICLKIPESAYLQFECKRVVGESVAI